MFHVLNIYIVLAFQLFYKVNRFGTQISIFCASENGSISTNVLLNIKMQKVESVNFIFRQTNIEGIPKNACGASRDISIWYLMCMIAK